MVGLYLPCCPSSMNLPFLGFVRSELLQSAQLRSALANIHTEGDYKKLLMELKNTTQGFYNSVEEIAETPETSQNGKYKPQFDRVLRNAKKHINKLDRELGKLDDKQQEETKKEWIGMKQDLRQ